MKTNIASSSAKTRAATPVTTALQQLLADSYALMGNTHHAHWNIEGPDFFQLHKAFQEQYENLFEAIDEIAEQARVLDAFPVGGLATLAKQSGIEELPLTASAKDFVAALVVGHEKAHADAITLRDTAGAADDLETQDLAIDRVRWHGKTLWMLKSYLK
ncbi:MAG TPA: DNA starvation/stationary phase protection protein [Opitutaceae bacterium]|nr:DNA starvation/stationary phase protection protein [Opitutaceae bacterium]